MPQPSPHWAAPRVRQRQLIYPAPLHPSGLSERPRPAFMQLPRTCDLESWITGQDFILHCERVG